MSVKDTAIRATKPIIPLGTRIPEYRAVVAAVGWLGERYYWLTKDEGGVVMLPADCLERGSKHGDAD